MTKISRGSSNGLPKEVGECVFVNVSGLVNLDVPHVLTGSFEKAFGILQSGSRKESELHVLRI
jgi:hypothetical protein